MPGKAASDEQFVRDGLEMWNRGEWEAALAMLSPDVEWRISEPLFDMPLVSHGRAGVRAFWEQWTEIWEEIVVDVERTAPFPGGVAAFVRWRARGRDGLEVDQHVAFAYELEGELVTRFTAYWNPDDAVEALGLSEIGDDPRRR